MPNVENIQNPTPQEDYIQMVNELSTCQELLKTLIQKIEVFKDVTAIKAQNAGGNLLKEGG